MTEGYSFGKDAPNLAKLQVSLCRCRGWRSCWGWVTCRRCYPSSDTTMGGERSPCLAKRKAQTRNTCWTKPREWGQGRRDRPLLARKNEVHSSLVNRERGRGSFLGEGGSWGAWVVSLLLTSAGESSFICWPDWTDEISIFFIKGLPASAAGLPFPITHSLSIMQKAKGRGTSR